MAKDPLEMLRQRAQEAISRGQYQEARQIYQQALGYRADSPDIHFGLATACFLLNDLPAAVEHFKEVVKLEPTRAGAHVNLGAVYNRLGQFEDALSSLRRGIKLDPNRAEAYYNLGLVYKQLGQLEMSVNAYREAVRINPRMYDAHYNLGNVLFERGQVPLAIAHYKAALEVRPDWEKCRHALDVAAQEQSAQDAAANTLSPPEIPKPAEHKLDPNRLVDPAFHGQLLRALHELVVESDTHTHEMLEFLQKEVEGAIRELSICVLTPNDPKYKLDEQIIRFDAVVKRLDELHKAMTQRMGKVKLLGEQTAKL